MTRSSYPARARYTGEAARDYLQRRAGSAKWRREQEVVAGFLRELPRGATVLDVPVGTGRFLPCYREAGLRCYGLDISRDMLREAGRAAEAEGMGRGLVQGEAEALPLANGSVDFVVCARLMNWVPLPALIEMLSEFKRVARYGLILEVRVSRPIGAVDVLRKRLGRWLSDPGAAARRWRGRLLSPLHRVKRLMTGGYPPAAPDRQAGAGDGYLVHREEDLERLFGERGLVLLGKGMVDERLSPAGDEAQPFMVYRLGHRAA